MEPVGELIKAVTFYALGFVSGLVAARKIIVWGRRG